MNIWQQRMVDDMKRAVPDLPDDVIRAAVSWVRSGELDRHYGAAFTVAYSLKHVRAAGLLGPSGPQDAGLTDEEINRVYVAHAEECPSHSLFPAQCTCGHQELKAKLCSLLAASPREDGGG